MRCHSNISHQPSNWCFTSCIQLIYWRRHKTDLGIVANTDQLTIQWVLYKLSYRRKQRLPRIIKSSNLLMLWEEFCSWFLWYWFLVIFRLHLKMKIVFCQAMNSAKLGGKRVATDEDRGLMLQQIELNSTSCHLRPSKFQQQSKQRRLQLDSFQYDQFLYFEFKYRYNMGPGARQWKMG